MSHTQSEQDRHYLACALAILKGADYGSIVKERAIAALEALLATAPQVPATQSELEANLDWNALYVAANYLVCKIGAHGSADSDDNEVTNLMDALHKIDGGIVSERAQELHEKAHMPIFDATRLAILECPSNFGHPHDFALTEDGACAWCGLNEETTK